MEIKKVECTQIRDFGAVGGDSKRSDGTRADVSLPCNRPVRWCLVPRASASRLSRFADSRVTSRLCGLGSRGDDPGRSEFG